MGPICRPVLMYFTIKCVHKTKQTKKCALKRKEKKLEQNGTTIAFYTNKSVKKTFFFNKKNLLQETKKRNKQSDRQNHITIRISITVYNGDQ